MFYAGGARAGDIFSAHEPDRVRLSLLSPVVVLEFFFFEKKEKKVRDVSICPYMDRLRSVWKVQGAKCTI